MIMISMLDILKVHNIGTPFSNTNNKSLSEASIAIHSMPVPSIHNPAHPNIKVDMESGANKG